MTHAQGSELRVLVEDSDQSVRTAIVTALSRDDRVGTVDQVECGDEAVSRCDLFDVVVVGLRSSSGLGSLGTIHRIAHRHGHPSIVGIDPGGEEWLGRAARAAGADEVLEWPMDGAALTNRILGAGRRW